ncbi:SEC-C metal-binding domain-containing protein [Stenotrophomonas pavanii]|uniref:SEC-C metal-binding domain-containing protein n=1 Tax=Stenotrophomonas pavanii TaxID=487698 RepID=UPI003F95647B
MSVAYLSDSKADYKLLEQLIESGEFGRIQKATLPAEPEDEFWDKVLSRVHDTNREFMSTIDSDQVADLKSYRKNVTLPTRFDSWASYWIVSELVKDVKAASDKLGITSDNFPEFATIPTKTVNALAVKPKGSAQSFLLFDGEILTFCHLISKIFSQAFPVTNKNDRNSFTLDTSSIEHHIKASPHLLQRLSAVLDAFIKTGYVGCTPPFPVDPLSAPLMQCLRKGMELFVVAHEFGHVHSGHLGDLLPSLEVISKRSPPSRAHEMEFEADHIGLVLTILAQRDSGLDVAMSIAGIKLLFLALDLSDAYETAIKFGGKRKFASIQSESHPSNQQRWDYIEAALPSIGISPEEVSESRDLAAKLDVVSGIFLQLMLHAKTTPGRNDPCTCGSNKKYKKCCMP